MMPQSTHLTTGPLIGQRLRLMVGLGMLLAGSLAMGGYLVYGGVSADLAALPSCQGNDCTAAVVADLARRSLRTRSVMVGLVMFTLVWLGAYWLVGSWVERLHQFTQAVKRFELDQDDKALAPFSQAPFPDEFAQLSHHFQNTLHQLHQRERLMESSSAMYHLIFNLASIGMAVMSLDGRYLRVNASLCKTLGYTEAELLQLSQQEITYRADQEVSSALVKKLLDEGQPYAQVKKRYVSKTGRTVHVLLKIALMYDSQNQPLSFLVQVVDLTRHKLAEQALQRAEERYQVLFENANEGIFQMTREGYYISANPALASILGYDSPESLITTLTDVSQQLFVDAGAWTEFLARMDDAGEVSDYKTQVYCRDGESLWVSFSVHPVQDGGGNCLYFEGTVKDITDRHQAEEKLLYSALYDALTGLPNRTQFTTQLQHSLTLAEQENRDFTLLFLDLDRFKVVNDSLGPLVGDQLLVQLSDRLRSCLKASDTLARLGGDEFAILLDGTRSSEDALAVAQAIHSNLHSPFQLQEQEFFVTASIGLVPCRDSSTQALYTSIEDLLRDADIAMYGAKRSGTSSEVFNRSSHSSPLSQLQLETALRRGLERNELQLMYQPIVSSTTGAVSSFEALVRWNHPELGMISPVRFIPAAEESGLIIALGAWVLEEACNQLKRWQQEGIAGPQIKIAVNVSGRQLTQANIVEQIREILHRTALAPQCLRVEITESVLIGDERAVERRLEAIKAIGVDLCIDDFGTGYSSFSRLHRFPIDALKIDRSFVISSRAQQGRWEIINAIVGLTDKLKIGAIAEGVETAEQLAQIQKSGCEYIQGYFFSGPMSAADAANLLSRGGYEIGLATPLVEQSSPGESSGSAPLAAAAAGVAPDLALGGQLPETPPEAAQQETVVAPSFPQMSLFDV